ncbi:MAG: cupin [Arcobacter sp.]|nr:cupin [Arcobacter sp.]
MIKRNLLENIVIDKENEKIEDILKTRNIRIERIISNGQSTEEDFWYDQEENEFVILLEGNAILEIKEDNKIKQIELVKNEYINIKANVKHRVKYTDSNNPTIWLTIFY